LLFFPVVMVSALLVASALSIDTVTAFSLGRFLRTVLTALPIFFVFAIFEEVGWRGYLAPKLASLGIGSFSAAAAVAIVWGSWHLPYIRDLTWIYSSEPLTTFIPRFYLLSFVLALVFGEIRMITGTFWPAVLMHAVGNAFGHPLEAGYVKVAGGREFLGNLGNGLIMIGLVAVLGVGIHRWRLNARSSLPK
jgi:membrane protease YdiL (CAAX protease family)